MARMGDLEAEKLLKKWRIPVVKQVLAKTEQQAAEAAKKLGYPVVLKISSPDVLHKTDVGGLVVGIEDEEALKKAYADILKNVKKKQPKAKIAGILVQQMVSGKDVREVILGSKLDDTFGPVVMFGLGGIFVEVLEDVAFRLAPLNPSDAAQMVQEIKGYPVLGGARGQKPVNFKALEDTLVKFSKMVASEKKIQEMDINPLFVDSRGVLAGDIRVLV